MNNRMINGVDKVTLLEAQLESCKRTIQLLQAANNHEHPIENGQINLRSNGSASARSLIEASLDPLVTINSAGEITDVNTAAENVTGVARNKLIGSDFAIYYTEPEKAREAYRTAFKDGQVTNYPLSIRDL